MIFVKTNRSKFINADKSFIGSVILYKRDDLKEVIKKRISPLNPKVPDNQNMVVCGHPEVKNRS